MKDNQKYKITIEEYLKTEGAVELTEQQKESDEYKESVESCRRIAAGDDD